MRVFVAGGTGVIGRRLVPQLVGAGHEVTATTRTPAKAQQLRSLGATPAVLDALDGQAVAAAVRAAAPEVVMNQLTRLPQHYHPRKLRPWFEATSRLRVDGTRHLLAAAREVGARRFVYQSIAFMYATDEAGAAPRPVHFTAETGRVGTNEAAVTHHRLAAGRSPASSFGRPWPGASCRRTAQRRCRCWHTRPGRACRRRSRWSNRHPR